MSGFEPRTSAIWTTNSAHVFKIDVLKGFVLKKFRSFGEIKNGEETLVSFFRQLFKRSNELRGWVHNLGSKNKV